MSEGETYKFKIDSHESKIACLVSNTEILVFLDMSQALNAFTKIEDPRKSQNSRITFFTFLGRSHLLIANNHGEINIFHVSQSGAEHVSTYTLNHFQNNREQLISGSIALKEDFIGFLTSNYSTPNQCFSNIHLYRIMPDKATLAADMVINMEMFKQHGYDPNLVAINLDFDMNDFPFILGFPRTSPFIYSFDISGDEIKTKAIDVGHLNTKSLAYFENFLFGLDRKMQVIEISNLKG